MTKPAQAETDPNVIVITTPNQYNDLSGIYDTTVLAIGAAEQLDLAGEDYDPGEGYGNTVVVTGNKSDVILGSDDDYSRGNDIQLFGYGDTVTQSIYYFESFDTIEANGKDANIDVGGYNTVTLNGTDNLVTIEPILIADDEDPMGENAVIANGAGKESVIGGGAYFSFTGGSGRYSIDGGNAEHTTISGGAGGGVFTGGYYYTDDYSIEPYYNGHNVITAGLQASTLVGGLHGQSLLIANGSAPDTLIAGEYGQDTLSGGTSTANNLYEGYNGSYVPSDDMSKPSLVIEAGSGNDTLVAGISDEVLIGGAGHDLFRFISHAGAVPPGGNQTIITDFTPGTDKIDLVGFSVTSEQVVAAETISGGSTYLSLPDGEKIKLLHVTDLSAKNFTHS